jgi:tRNA dimethylallyltransferase
MLIYKGMNIGTAKPTSSELSRVRHHLIDVVPPQKEFNASQYLKAVDALYGKMNGRIIGVGGTPFYLKVLRDGLHEIHCLEGLEQRLGEMSEPWLRSALEKLDPERSAAILPNDRFRLARALTLIYSTGLKASRFKIEQGREGVSLRIVALRGERSLMHQLMKDRIEQMFKAGLLEEARALYEGAPLSKTAAAGVGYKELFAHFRGELSLEEAKFKILVGTRRLYKHQMTWLSKMDVDWVDVIPGKPELAWEKVKPLLEEHFRGII